ncbi:PIR protein CIR protein, fragment [Plasmodium vinckei lentum]|uniref:PIR protein CIR protein n=1 Tax=Plasmodium vinckei lentum TaxID=138297 RepID=A0A6V7SUC6_PLAVN|nr:PIR protein CIR protein, fragment [Plasmodium vinckei lentum]
MKGDSYEVYLNNHKNIVFLQGMNNSFIYICSIHIINTYRRIILLKGINQLNNVAISFETIKNKIIEAKDTIKDLYSRPVSNIQFAYDKFSSFLNVIIDHISSQHENVDLPSTPGDGQSISDDTGNELNTPNDPSPPQKHTP